MSCGSSFQAAGRAGDGAAAGGALVIELGEFGEARCADAAIGCAPANEQVGVGDAPLGFEVGDTQPGCQQLFRVLIAAASLDHRRWTCKEAIGDGVGIIFGQAQCGVAFQAQRVRAAGLSIKGSGELVAMKLLREPLD